MLFTLTPIILLRKGWCNWGHSLLELIATPQSDLDIMQTYKKQMWVPQSTARKGITLSRDLRPAYRYFSFSPLGHFQENVLNKNTV